MRRQFRMDGPHRVLDLNLLFEPLFDTEILDDNERSMTYIDIDGVKRIFLKESATIPAALDWLIKNPRRYPRLQMLGAIPKSDIALGVARIREVLEPVGEVLESGGDTSFCDHFVPPEVSFEDFAFYRSVLNKLVDPSAGPALP